MDVVCFPYRWKYVEEHPSRAFSPWFIFGESPDGTHVDIADQQGDVVMGLPRKKAERMIAARDTFLKECEKINDELREES